MKTKLLIAASVLAVMAAAPAIAETSADANVEVKTENNAPSLSKDVKREWDKTKENVSNAADKTSEAVKETYQDIKASLIDDDAGATPTDYTVNSRHTAANIIGQPVLDSTGKKIAKVEDILLDAEGDATHVIVADGGFAGIGTKLAAFDYDLVSQRNKDGDVIMPISEESLKKVTAFSYDKADAKEGVRIIPDTAISAKKLMDGEIIDAAGKKVASIDNIALKEGEAAEVIIGFDKIVGLGGEKAAVDFDDLKLVRDGGELDLQLSATQAANFETFKKTATN